VYFLCRLVLFFIMLTKRFAAKTTTFVIYFASKGFPYKDCRLELFIVVVYCMYSQHVTLPTVSLFSIFKNCNVLFEGTI